MKAVQVPSATSNTTSIPTELVDAPEWAQDIFQNLPCLASYDDVGRVSRMSRGSIANYHSAGCGPKGSILVGKKRCFPRLEVVRWLQAYPRKVGKGNARTAWAKLQKQKALPDLENLLATIGRQKQSPQWQEAKFIPHTRQRG